MTNAEFKEFGVWKGPIFSPSVERLHKVFSQKLLANAEMLSRAGAQLSPGRGVCMGPKTSDGYTWFMALFYTCGSGMVGIFFPVSRGWSNRDGRMNERHIALYTQGEIDEKELTRLVEMFTDELDKNPWAKGISVETSDKLH